MIISGGYNDTTKDTEVLDDIPYYNYHSLKTFKRMTLWA